MSLFNSTNNELAVMMNQKILGISFPAEEQRSLKR